MKAKINSKGRLSLQRTTISNAWIPQRCCNGNDEVCDIFCPLFGEPIKKRTMNGTIPGSEIVQLPLCHTVLILESLSVEDLIFKDSKGE